MHEIGIVRSMCKTVLDYAEQNGVQEISEIVCEIGERWCFRILTAA